MVLMNKLPRESDTPVENLTTKQVMNMLRAICKDCLCMTPTIYAEEDGVINIHGQMKLAQTPGGWLISGTRVRRLQWYPMKDPTRFFPEILAVLAREKLDEWMLINYSCLA